VDPAQYRLFVEQLVTVVLERNDSARQSLGNLILNALKHAKIETVHVVEGLKSVLALAEDMIIDIPRIKTYLSGS
jgi:hypothetical protein